MKNPHPQNTAKWWLFNKIESRKGLIRSRRDDIERAEKSIRECEAEVEAAEAELALLTEAKS